MLKDRGELRRWLFACEASRHGPQAKYRQRAGAGLNHADQRRIFGIEDAVELAQPPLYTGEAEEGDAALVSAVAAAPDELISLFKRHWMTAIKRARDGSVLSGTLQNAAAQGLGGSADSSPGAKGSIMKMEDAPPAHELPVDIREIKRARLTDLESENATKPPTKPDWMQSGFHGRRGQKRGGHGIHTVYSAREGGHDEARPRARHDGPQVAQGQAARARLSAFRKETRGMRSIKQGARQSRPSAFCLP